MLNASESNGTLQRTVCLTIRPTVAEIADAIVNLNATEQVTLLGCLKRRLCNNEAGAMQMAYITNALSNVPKEKSDEAKEFVRCLADYVSDEQKITDELKHLLTLWEDVVDRIRAQNKAYSGSAYITLLCDKLKSSISAYAKGNTEFAHFAI